MLRPDGWGWRARIGVLIPHFDVVPESEFHAMAPEGVSIHGARVPFDTMAASKGEGLELARARAFAEPPFIDDAAEVLAAAPLDAIAYAFTSSSYVRGADDEAALKVRLARRTRGLPVVTTCAAVVGALRALGVSRLALVHPPWFSKELNQLGAEYFRLQRVEVVYAASADLPGGQHGVHPGRLYAWAQAHVPTEAEAVFIGGNGLRAVSIIQALEEDLGRPVLSANQVLFWHALRLAGVRAPIMNYGRIFAHDLPS